MVVATGDDDRGYGPITRGVTDRHEVRGSDAAVYPPMSEQLAALGVPVMMPYQAGNLDWGPELVVVGKPRDGSSIPSVIDRLGLDGHVTFVSGVAHDRMVELYNEAEVAVVPSLYEGFSLPAIEAMACGTPLVATTGGALPEVVGPDGRNALTVAPGDAGALAGAIGRVLDDPALGERLGIAGRAHVLDRFTWAEMARQTVEQYRLAIDEQSRGNSCRNSTAISSKPAEGQR